MRIGIFRSQNGDTIVEVLIAMAVISAVLGTSYAIVNRNTKSYQQVNEHSEALKLSERQLEKLRQIAVGTDASKKAAVFSGATPFCIDDVLHVNASTPCTDGVDNRYTIQVLRTGADQFESIVTWTGVTGGTDRVSLSYRIEQ